LLSSKFWLIGEWSIDASTVVSATSYDSTAIYVDAERVISIGDRDSEFSYWWDVSNNSLPNLKTK
jgi:hypothetical protein